MDTINDYHFLIQVHNESDYEESYEVTKCNIMHRTKYRVLVDQDDQDYTQKETVYMLIGMLITNVMLL